MSFECCPARSHPGDCSATSLCDNFDRIPVLPESMLSSFLDLRNPLHCVDSGLHEITVITNRDIPAFLEIDSRILGQVKSKCIGE